MNISEQGFLFCLFLYLLILCGFHSMHPDPTQPPVPLHFVFCPCNLPPTQDKIKFKRKERKQKEKKNPFLESESLFETGSLTELELTDWLDCLAT